MAVAESSRKVLVVEPDSSTRREIKLVCEQDGYQVVEADAGSEALRQVEHARPSVVLLEVTLPDVAGFDVCRELRKMDPAVPVIMMSSRSDEIDAVVALEIGADDYVTKPLRIRELVARMAAHLRRTRLESVEATRSRLEFRELLIDVNDLWSHFTHDLSQLWIVMQVKIAIQFHRCNNHTIPARIELLEYLLATIVTLPVRRGN